MQALRKKQKLDGYLKLLYNGNVPVIGRGVRLNKRPTIIDVARTAGVSKSTVSRVIADDGHGVNPETQKRVLQAIEEELDAKE